MKMEESSVDSDLMKPADQDLPCFENDIKKKLKKGMYTVC